LFTFVYFEFHLCPWSFLILKRNVAKAITYRKIIIIKYQHVLYI